MPPVTIQDGLVVSLDYTLRLDDGEIVDQSDERGPLNFLQGKGQIIPGLEKALYGMSVGDEKDVVVQPGEGYGERDPEAKAIVPLNAFPPNMVPEPGMQLYTANGFDGRITGTGGVVYPRHAGFCFETQHFPDSVHHSNFPSVILRPGQVFRSTTAFRFTNAQP